MDVTSTERDIEGVFVSSSVYMHHCKVTQIILLSLVTPKVHGEWTHSIQRERMSSFITCSWYKVSQWLSNFQVSACLANTSWKSLWNRQLKNKTSAQQGKCQKPTGAPQENTHLFLALTLFSLTTVSFIIDLACKTRMLKQLLKGFLLFIVKLCSTQWMYIYVVCVCAHVSCGHCVCLFVNRSRVIMFQWHRVWFIVKSLSV